MHLIDLARSALQGPYPLEVLYHVRRLYRIDKKPYDTVTGQQPRIYGVDSSTLCCVVARHAVRDPISERLAKKFFDQIPITPSDLRGGPVATTGIAVADDTGLVLAPISDELSANGRCVAVAFDVDLADDSSACNRLVEKRYAAAALELTW